MKMHELMAATLDTVVADIQRLQLEARASGFKERPRWPMIILRSPKGWTGPASVDGKPTEGTFRSHQVPMGDMNHSGHVQLLEDWMRSYRPQELFDHAGRLIPELAAQAPTGERRMSANFHANGGRMLRELKLPNFRNYAVPVPQPGSTSRESTRAQGEFIRDVIKENPENFLVFSPDETNSNRWNAVFEVTTHRSTAEIVPGDDRVAPDGRVFEMLSEHQCQGWLEGCLLTGRHGFFSCYEAFDMAVRNDLDRFHLFADVVVRVPKLRPHAEESARFVQEKLAAHHSYITTHGDDLPEIKNWKWAKGRPL